MNNQISTITQGFKQTDIGLYPTDWEVISLKDISRYRRGSFPQPYGLSKWYNDFTGAPFIQVFDVDENFKLKNETKRRISKLAQQMSVFVKKGSIVLTIQGSIGRIAITQYDAYVDRTLLLFEAFLKPVDLYYFAYSVFRLFEKEKLYAPGGIIKTITKERLSSFLIALPPLEEQKNISKLLYTLDSLIENLEKQITKKQAIKRGLTQQLLTGKFRLSGYKEEWEQKSLGELLIYEQPTKYLVKTEEYSADYLTPVLTAGKSFILGYSNEETGIYDNLPVIIFDDFTTDSKYVDFRFKAKSSAMKMLKLRFDKLNLRYVYERMQLIDFVLKDHKRYWISEYQNIKVMAPSFEEQNAITRVLTDCDKEISLIEAKLLKFKQLKQGALQALLTGKIRLAKN